MANDAKTKELDKAQEELDKKFYEMSFKEQAAELNAPPVKQSAKLLSGDEDDPLDKK